MKVLIATMLVFINTGAFATNYYLSGNGNDLQSGTSTQAPWGSLKKLSEASVLLQAGDSIFLERGSVFEGELKLSASGKPGSHIYVGSYGRGAKPVIVGSVEVKNWTLVRKNIWVAACAGEPGDLFIDDRYHPLGRYPNSGYRKLSCKSDCQSSFKDGQLMFDNDYWNGGEVVVKSSRWTLDVLPVSSYSNKTFSFSTPASYAIPDGNGYFIQNHLGTLDRAGEWYFDKTSKKIFLYSEDTHNPNQHKIEVSVRETGLELLKSAFVTVENIVFKYQRNLGIQVQYCNSISLRNCEVWFADNGIEISSCQSPSVEGCRIEDSRNNGVDWRDNTDGSFVRNSIHRTGLLPGRARSGNGTCIGISISGDNNKTGKNLFQYNSIDSTGYIGIDFRTGGNLIKNNVISNFCMVKDDGAGIYTWGNANGNNQIVENIVRHGLGSGAGTKDFDKVWVSGIYIDDRSADVQISQNTVAYCGTTGIYVHNAKRISIEGNNLYANGANLTNKEKAQLTIKLDNLVTWGEEKVLDLRVFENTLVATQEGNYCIYLQAEKEGDLKSLGFFDRNVFLTPDPRRLVSIYVGHQDLCDAPGEINLVEWKQKGNDVNSRFNVTLPATEYAGPNLIDNGGMKSAQGWVSWPAGASMAVDKKTGAAGSSLKVDFPFWVSDAMLYSSGLRLRSNTVYRLTFSARSEKKTNLEFAPLMASAPWEALGDYACFSVDSTFKEFTYYFRPYRNHPDARLNFKCRDTFWIDEVTLSEITPNPESKNMHLEMICNESEKQKKIPAVNVCDLDGNSISQPIILPGYHSVIVRRIP